VKNSHRAASFDVAMLNKSKIQSIVTEIEEYENEEKEIVSNVEYIQFPEKDTADSTIIQYKMNNKALPMFNIYGLPRNSDYEFQQLDQHFFNQCEWMRHLSPSQLGIESIYWCDTPPLTLHANSDILLNVKDTHTVDAYTLFKKGMQQSITPNASLSDLNYSSFEYANPNKKKKRRKKKKKQCANVIESTLD